MKIQINPALEKKLLLDSGKMQMSATQYINFLIEYIEIRIPEQERIVITKEIPKLDPVRLGEGMNRKDFINDF